MLSILCRVPRLPALALALILLLRSFAAARSPPTGIPRVVTIAATTPVLPPAAHGVPNALERPNAPAIVEPNGF